MKTEFNIGDWVWLDVWVKDNEITPVIGQINGIRTNAFWKYRIYIQGLRWGLDRPATAIKLATDSEVAWFLVSNNYGQ